MKKKTSKFFKNLIIILNRQDMAVLPSQLAFNFVLAIVPTLTIVTLIANIFNISMQDINSYFNLNLSPSIYNMLKPSVHMPGYRISLILLLLIGIYISSNGMSSMIVAANNIYDIKQSSWLNRKIKGVIMVFIIIMLFLFVLFVPVFGNFILNLLENATGQKVIYDIISILKTPFSWIIIYVFIKVLYTIAPDKNISSKVVTRGALLTTVGWIIATYVYLYYVNNFSNYAVFYSGLSNIAILMIWIYLLAFIFVIGMGINYQYELDKKGIKLKK